MQRARHACRGSARASCLSARRRRHRLWSKRLSLLIASAAASSSGLPQLLSSWSARTWRPRGGECHLHVSHRMALAAGNRATRRRPLLLCSRSQPRLRTPTACRSARDTHGEFCAASVAAGSRTYYQLSWPLSRRDRGTLHVLHPCWVRLACMQTKCLLRPPHRA